MVSVRGVGGRKASALGCAGALLALALSGCGTGSTTSSSAGPGVVSVVISSPTDGSVIAADHVTIRGTVTPTNASVQVQGKPAAVGNGVFTGVAALHGGKTTVDVIGSARGAAPGSTHISIARQAAGGPARTSTVTTMLTTKGEQVPEPAETGELAFFAPSGNVSCVIQGDGARCSVASIDTTFVLPPGGAAAYRRAGAEVPRAGGSEAPFGTVRSNGAVRCTIPPSNVPAGISCLDSASGHGFEASRVPSRQKTY